MLRLILTLPFLILLVVFVVYNPTASDAKLPGLPPWSSSLGVITLVTAVIFFLVGALFVWFAELRQRGRARRAEQQVRTLEGQVAELRTQLSQAVAQNVAYHGTTTVAAHPGPGTLPIAP